jgi:hypothetical protein
MRLEALAVVHPFASVEAALLIETVHRGIGHRQGMVRVVVSEQALTAERYDVRDTVQPVVDLLKI